MNQVPAQTIYDSAPEELPGNLHPLRKNKQHSQAPLGVAEEELDELDRGGSEEDPDGLDRGVPRADGVFLRDAACHDEHPVHEVVVASVPPALGAEEEAPAQQGVQPVKSEARLLDPADGAQAAERLPGRGANSTSQCWLCISVFDHSQGKRKRFFVTATSFLQAIVYT